MNKRKFENFPLRECAKAAEKLIAEGATVFQKWTCQHCGERQTMPTPNMFFTLGKCEECKRVTDIDKTGCNYAVIWAFGGDGKPRNPLDFL